MKTAPSTTPGWSDDDLRLLRVARSLRAVAASLIVGGIAFAAIQTSPSSDRPPSLEATPQSTPGYAASEPGSGETAAATSDAREADPARQKIERAQAERG